MTAQDPYRRLPERLLAGLPLVPEPGKPRPSEDLLYDSRLCLAGCDLCQQAAPEVITRTLDGLIIDRQNVNDKHITALRDCCPTTALTVCGEEKNVEAIMATVLRDKPFYDRSGGGITPFRRRTLYEPDAGAGAFRSQPSGRYSHRRGNLPARAVEIH
ncbi:hypothetical protein LNO81_08555 [Klebsiella variicola subsp. variicola]|nr:hypothetical protein [Klebsiella variicola subsp. variicola]